MTENLSKLSTPKPCDCCDAGTAQWGYSGYAICVECMVAMSAMNSDNEAVFAVALSREKGASHYA